MKSVRAMLCVLIAAILLVPLTAFGAPKDQITIGLLASITGPMSFQGNAIVRGFTLAMEEAGYKVAGKTINVVTEDEVVSPARGVIAPLFILPRKIPIGGDISANAIPVRR